MRKFIITVMFCLCACCVICGLAACDKTVSVSGISFSQSSVELYVGDEYQLEYTILPENASDSSVTFYSSDESIVTVNNDGVVCAVSEGETDVSVTANDGGFTAYCAVTVIQKQEGNGENKDQESGDDTEYSEDLSDGQGQTDGEKDNEESDKQEQEDGEDTEDTEDTEDIENITSYTVTFIADDETIVCKFTEDNLSIDEPEVPKKDGYTGEWESYSLTLENIIVKAIYTPIHYEITFIAANVIVDKVDFTIESVSIAEPSVPTIEGYDGKWESYSIKCEDFSVYAVYTIKNYTITYENTKGTENSNPESYNVETVYALENLTAEGYIFEGWYTGDERVYSLNGGYGDLTLTAKWSLIQYTIRFVDECYNEIATAYYTVEDEAVTFPESIQKDGYTVSWSDFILTYDISIPVIVHIAYTKTEE